MPDNVEEFAKKVRSKHPEYADLSDSVLTRRVLQRYPQYHDMVSLPNTLAGLNVDQVVRSTAQQFGLQVTSAKRTPAQQQRLIEEGKTQAVHSYHLRGQALDLAGDKGKMKAFYDHLVDNYGGELAELLNEGNHIHVAWKQSIPQTVGTVTFERTAAGNYHPLQRSLPRFLTPRQKHAAEVDYERKALGKYIAEGAPRAPEKIVPSQSVNVPTSRMPVLRERQEGTMLGAAGQALEIATRPFQFLSTLTAGAQRRIGEMVDTGQIFQSKDYADWQILEAATERFYTGRVRPGYEQPVAKLYDLLVEKYGGDPSSAFNTFMHNTLEIGTDPTTYLPMEELAEMVTPAARSAAYKEATALRAMQKEAQAGFGEIRWGKKGPLGLVKEPKAKTTAKPTTPVSPAAPEVPTGRKLLGPAPAVTTPVTEAGTVDPAIFGVRDLQRFFGNIGDISRGVMHTLAPALGVDEKAIGTLFKMKGQRAQALMKVSAVFEDAGKMFNKLPRQQGIDFIDRIKSGMKQPTPELQQLADAIRYVDDTMYNEVKKWKPSLPYLQDHFRNMWKELPQDLRAGQPQRRGLFEKIGLTRRPFRGTMGFTRQHKLADLSQGLRWEMQGTAADWTTAAQKAGLKSGTDISIASAGAVGGKETQLIPLSQKGLDFLNRAHAANPAQTLFKGGVPITWNPIEMFVQHYADATKFTTAQKTWERFGTDKLRKFVKFGQQVPEGFVRLNDSIARVYFPSPQGMVNAGEWYVEEGAGRLLNNYLSRDLLREQGTAIGATGRTLLGIKNITTALELGLSPFHLTFESVEAMSSQLGLAVRRMWNLGVLKGNVRQLARGAGEAVTTPKAPLSAARLGGSLIQYAKDPAGFAATLRGQKFLKQFPQAKHMVDLLFEAGGDIRMNEAYKMRMRESFRKELSEGNIAGALPRGVIAGIEAVTQPMFEQYIPRLKLGVWLKEMEVEIAENAGRLARGEVTESQLARRAWAFTEDRFGEMNFDNLFWNRTFKSAAQLFLRSVTWKLGNVRAFGSVPIEQWRAVTTGKGLERLQLGRNAGWAIGMSALTAGLSTLAMKAYTGKYPETIRDLINPRIDAHDDSKRMSPPTYFRDIESLRHSPSGYVTSSMAGEWGRIYDVWRNKDFQGYEIRTPGDPLGQQVWDVVGHVFPAPIGPAKAIKDIKKEGVGKAAREFAGFTDAPRYVGQSEGSQLLDKKLDEQFTKEAPRPKAEREQLRLKSEIRQLGSTDPQAAGKALVNAVRAGKLTQKQAEWQEKHLGQTTLQYRFGLLKSLDDMEAVYKGLTDAEKAQVQSIIDAKRHGPDKFKLRMQKPRL